MDMAVEGLPGDPFSAWDVENSTGVTRTAQAIADSLAALFEPLYNASVSDTLSRVELWKYTPGTYEAAFQSSYSPSFTASGSGGVNDAEAIVTFRTAGGGIARLHVMEPVAVVDPGLTLGMPSGVTEIDALASFLTTAPKVMLGRDNTYVISALNYHPGISEALFKDRYRP
jgi:hypothetical protein